MQTNLSPEGSLLKVCVVVMKWVTSLVVMELGSHPVMSPITQTLLYSNARADRLSFIFGISVSSSRYV